MSRGLAAKTHQSLSKRNLPLNKSLFCLHSSVGRQLSLQTSAATWRGSPAQKSSRGSASLEPHGEGTVHEDLLTGGKNKCSVVFSRVGWLAIPRYGFTF